MSPGPSIPSFLRVDLPPWREWVAEHYDPLIWTFLAFTLATALLLAWGIGYEMGRRELKSRPVYLPGELAE